MFDSLGLVIDGMRNQILESPKIAAKFSLLPDMVAEGRSVNTRKTYHYSFNQWQKWAVENDCKVIPAVDVSVAIYLAELVEARANFAKIHGIFFAISYHHRLGNYQDPCHSPLVRRIYDVAKRTCKKGTNRKELLTAKNLEDMFSVLGGEKPTLSDMRLRSVIVLCFAGFLRFDEASEVKLRDISFESQHMKLFIPGSKGDIYREGNHVRIASTHGKLCPVNTLYKYIDVASLKPEEYLFRAITVTRKGEYLTKKNSPISYQRIRLLLLETARKAGIDRHAFFEVWRCVGRS